MLLDVLLQQRQRNRGPGYLCQGCINVNVPEPPDDSDEKSDEDSEYSYTESEEEPELIEEEVITDD